MPKAPSEAEVRAIIGNDLWATCDHPGAEPTHHRCPRCGGTLRRCCDSIVGYHAHRAGCPEVARRATEQVS